MKSPLRLLVSLVSSIALTLGAFTIVAPSTASAATQTPCTTWVRVIDVSSNNTHPINWKLVVKSAKVAGAYVKNTEGTSYVNPYFTKDTADASKAGIPWGVYHFAQPGKADPVASAKWFVKNGGNRGQLPPALDLEVTKLSPGATAAWAMKWLTTVQQLTNRQPIIYVGYYFPASNARALGQYPLWLPAYSNGYKPVPNVCAIPRPKVPTPWVEKGWVMWQFTSVAVFPGVHSHTDVSAAEPAWLGKWTGAGIQPSKVPNRPSAPLYSYGSHGIKVIKIQRILVNAKLLPKSGVDGVFGRQTKSALIRWQRRIGATPDGMWSVQTERASGYYFKHHKPMPVVTTTTTTTLKK